MDILSPEYEKWCDIINTLQDIEDEDLRNDLLFKIQGLSRILESKHKTTLKILRRQ